MSELFQKEIEKQPKYKRFKNSINAEKILTILVSSPAYIFD
jgi:hypothetical protein